MKYSGWKKLLKYLIAVLLAIMLFYWGIRIYFVLFVLDSSTASSTISQSKFAFRYFSSLRVESKFDTRTGRSKSIGPAASAC